MTSSGGVGLRTAVGAFTRARLSRAIRPPWCSQVGLGVRAERRESPKHSSAPGDELMSAIARASELNISLTAFAQPVHGCPFSQAHKAASEQKALRLPARLRTALLVACLGQRAASCATALQKRRRRG